ncbi:MAG TPA: C4-dicarboxylate ABC transporter permease [Lachnoclostridium sp.]|nr:C4-dicarboxylate ABC transporter permease [Lachnoclostridium sp.]
MSEKKEQLKKVFSGITLALGVFMCLFHLYASLVGTVTVMRQRVFHVGLVLIIATLASVKKKLNDESWNPTPGQWALEVARDIFITASAAIGTIYLYVIDKQIYKHVSWYTWFDVIIGVCVVLSVLEVTRRLIGWIMPCIALVSILYAKFGNLLPAVAACKGYSIKRITAYLFLSQDGIYGTPTGVSAQTVIMFIIFGAFLSYSGAGKAFIDLSYSLFGRFRGGPAKVSVVASALFGMINGSAVANVASTGSLTIPLMKKVGYEPEDSGAICAVASTGGQIMPPIMGAAAFIMAETIATDYRSIALAAALPAALYFFQVFFVVDLMAIKGGLHGMKKEELPDGKKILFTEGFLLLPIILLIVFLCILQWSSNKSALWAIGITLIVSWLTKENKMGIKRVCLAFGEAAQEICSVALACATAGIAIGMLSLTGLGLKMSSLLVMLSQGNLIFLMVLTMIAGVILGMGLPTSGVYIILSVLAAPALIELGVSPLSAHMFVFFFGVIAAITPPVALASYAGAGIAQANANITGWRAVKIGLAGFLIPYLFVLRPSVLLQGTPLEIVITAITSVIALMGLSGAMYAMPSKKMSIRIAMVVAALLTLAPGTMTDIFGLALMAGAFALGKMSSKNGTSVKTVRNGELAKEV